MTDATGSGAVAAGTPAALATALAYFESWTSGDLDRAMTYIADDITCDAPAGRLEGTAASVGSWARLSGASQVRNSSPTLGMRSTPSSSTTRRPGPCHRHLEPSGPRSPTVA